MKKETLKRNWILHYIKPEFLYLPYKGKGSYVQLILRYFNVRSSSWQNLTNIQTSNTIIGIINEKGKLIYCSAYKNNNVIVNSLSATFWISRQPWIKTSYRADKNGRLMLPPGQYTIKVLQYGSDCNSFINNVNSYTFSLTGEQEESTINIDLFSEDYIEYYLTPTVTKIKNKEAYDFDERSFKAPSYEEWWYGQQPDAHAPKDVYDNFISDGVGDFQYYINISNGLLKPNKYNAYYNQEQFITLIGLDILYSRQTHNYKAALGTKEYPLTYNSYPFANNINGISEFDYFYLEPETSSYHIGIKTKKFPNKLYFIASNGTNNSFSMVISYVRQLLSTGTSGTSRFVSALMPRFSDRYNYETITGMPEQNEDIVITRERLNTFIIDTSTWISSYWQGPTSIPWIEYGLDIAADSSAAPYNYIDINDPYPRDPSSNPIHDQIPFSQQLANAKSNLSIAYNKSNTLITKIINGELADWTYVSNRVSPEIEIHFDTNIIQNKRDTLDSSYSTQKVLSETAEDMETQNDADDYTVSLTNITTGYRRSYYSEIIPEYYHNMFNTNLRNYRGDHEIDTPIYGSAYPTNIIGVPKVNFGEDYVGHETWDWSNLPDEYTNIEEDNRPYLYRRKSLIIDISIIPNYTT